MIRRQYVLIVLFTVIFQIFFSTINTLPSDTTKLNDLGLPTTTTATTISNPTNKCESASIDEFPPLFFTYEQTRRGGIVVYIALILYSFAAIEIVCDDYFASALERISYNFNLTPDVAGATFMALATSASEFFTSMVGVFFVKSDIALGTIVGSAVFNILFVIALCALISTTVCELDAYPIVRDAGFYCIAVAVLYVIIYDQRVYWYEALALVLLYFVYVGILKLNDRLSRLIHRNSTNQKSLTTNENHPEQLQALNDTVELEQNLSTRARSVSESVMMSTSTHPAGGTNNPDDDIKRRLPYKPSKKRLKDTPDNQQIVANATEIFDPLKLPTKKYKIIKWLLMYPVRLLMHITIPDCRKEVFHNYYMLTFVMSTIWVAGLAYLLVWLVVVVGYTFNIRDSIMGLTVLAFGSSIEEIFSAIVMTRRGHPEMAIAGSIGSNVFDILMGLGIPWLFRNLMRFIHQPPPIEAVSIIGDKSLTASDSVTLLNNDLLSLANNNNNNPPLYVEIHSRGLVYSTIVLFIALITFLITFFINRCRLTKLYGIFLIVVWLSVVTLMCLFELNIFAVVHAEPCQNRHVQTV